MTDWESNLMPLDRCDRQGGSFNPPWATTREYTSASRPNAPPDGRFRSSRQLSAVTGAMQDMKLVWPSSERLLSYVTALERGWSPDNLLGEEAAREELTRIAANGAAFSRESGRYRSDRRADHASEWHHRPATSGLPTVALGRRALWQHRISLAARDRGTASVLSWPYRLFSRALETASGVCHACVCARC